MANDFQIANEHLMPVASQAALPCTNDVWFQRKLKVAKILSLRLQNRNSLKAYTLSVLQVKDTYDMKFLIFGSIHVL